MFINPHFLCHYKLESQFFVTCEVKNSSCHSPALRHSREWTGTNILSNHIYRMDEDKFPYQGRNLFPFHMGEVRPYII